MKKLFFLFTILLSFNISAEIYHGINIDAVYNDSDWSSKEDIKRLIDDYTSLIQYQNELDNCPDILFENIQCYDKIAEKIITNLYVYPEVNLKQYTQLKKTISDAFELKNCHNKYTWPAGNLCDIESISNLADFLRKYLQDLISSAKEKMFIYSPILKKYQ